MEKRQLLFIHGGRSFSNYASFLNYLKTTPIDDQLSSTPMGRRWKDVLCEELTEKGWEVFMPNMPNRQNAKYAEWKLWFERYLPFLSHESILVGHSLGGCFLTKYLTENQLPIVARALYLVAAPFEREDFGGEDGGDFMFDPHKLIRLESQLQKLYVFHSKDDQIVPYAHALKYHAALGSAMLVTFDDKGHFLSEDFPELVASILAVHSAKNVQ